MATYTMDFDNNSVEDFFMNIHYSFEWSEINFEEGDLSRNISNATAFHDTLKTLSFFGAKTDCGTYNDNGFTRVGYAKINGHEFIKNKVFNSKELKAALWEIAHPSV